MPVEESLRRFILAVDTGDAVRLFAQHPELRENRMRVLLQQLIAQARLEHNQDADDLLTSRAQLLAALQGAAAESTGDAHEETLRAHPLVQDVLARQTQASQLPREITRLLKYGRAAETRFERSNDPQDLDEARTTFDKMIEHPEFSAMRAEVGIDVLEHAADLALTSFVRSSNRSDLDRAMVRFESLLSLLPSESDERHDKGEACSLALLRACRGGGRQEDIDGVVAWQRRILQPAGATRFAKALKRFGDESRKLFGETNVAAFLQNALDRHREAIEAISAEDPERSEYLDTFAIDCKAAFDLTSHAAFLDEAIASWEAAVVIGQRTKTIPREYVADYANNLGTALVGRFRRTGVVADLSTAATHIERAADMVPPDYPRLSTLLSNAGAVQLMLFERTNEVQRLERATSLKSQALNLVDSGSPERRRLVVQVAGLLTHLYTHTHRAELVSESIKLLEDAKTSGPLTPSEAHALDLQYGHALRLRYQTTHAQEDFERAKEVLQAAAERGGALSQRAEPVMTELAALLRQKYQTTQDVGALERATQLLAQLSAMNVRRPSSDSTDEAFRGSPASAPARPADVSEDIEDATPARPAPAAARPHAAPPPQPGPRQVASVLSAEGPRELAIGATSVIQVRIEGAANAAPLAHRLEATIETIQPVVVVVTLRGHSVVLLDPWLKALMLPASGNAVTCEFRIEGTAEGDADVAVQFLQGDAPLGSLSFSIVVTARDAAAGTQRADAPMNAPVPADEGTLMLLIQELKAGDRVFFKYLVTSMTLGVHFQEYNSPPFQDRGSGARSAPLAYVQSIHKQVAERVLLNQDDLHVFERELQGIGADLCRQLFPPELIRWLWDRRPHIRTVQVVSFEPYIPWELIRLTHPDMSGAAAIDSKFLAEYQLVRTMHGKSAATSIGAADWRYLVADFAHNSYERAEGELQFLTSVLPVLGVTPIEVAPQPNALLDLLSDGQFDVLHVAGHAESAMQQIEDAALILGDRRTPDGIRPVTVKPGTVEGTADLNKRRPLIFLNACETGRQGPSLTDFGGWPQAFIRAGAGAYVGTAWAVRERPAIAFAQGFYESLLKGSTLAEATLHARTRAKAIGDASWLAFTVYGAPCARFVLAPTV